MFGCCTFASLGLALPSLPKDQKTKPIEATVNKAFRFNEIGRNRQKRSHGVYPALFHALTGVLALIFEKLLPKARRSDCGFGKRLEESGRPDVAVDLKEPSLGTGGRAAWELTVFTGLSSRWRPTQGGTDGDHDHLALKAYVPG